MQLVSYLFIIFIELVCYPSSIMLPYQRERSAAAVDIVLQEVLMHKYFLLPFILVTVSFILNCVNN